MSKSKAQVIKSFLQASGRAENIKGISAEDKAFQTLCEHFEEEPWIDFPRRATSEEDQFLGIDLVVETDFGKLYLQIKSSQASKKRFQKRKRRIMMEVVVVKPHESRDQVWENLKTALERLRRQILAKWSGETADDL